MTNNNLVKVIVWRDKDCTKKLLSLIWMRKYVGMLMIFYHQLTII